MPEKDPFEALWCHDGITCAVVPRELGYDVRLKNREGVTFLRKSAPTAEAALNEAEYLRLLLDADRLPAPPAELRPFVLVVEDDESSCDAYAEALRSVGIRALGVPRGLDGVRLTRSLIPDLVVVDYRLPDITGAEVCRRLRDDPETEPLPVIAVTGAPESMRTDGCLADAILTKPCGMDTFLAATRLLLHRGAAR